jgi:hypothetical protein
LLAEFNADDHFIRPGFGQGFKQDIRFGIYEVNVKNILLSGRMALTTCGPKEMFGTK